MVHQVRVAQEKGADAVIVAFPAGFNLQVGLKFPVAFTMLVCLTLEQVDRKTSSLSSEDIQKVVLLTCVFFVARVLHALGFACLAC